MASNLVGSRPWQVITVHWNCKARLWCISDMAEWTVLKKLQTAWQNIVIQIKMEQV